MKLNKLLVLIFITTNCTFRCAQILHTKSFAVILDTNRIIKGNIVPDFKFQNLKEDFLEFENTTDISFRIKKSAITVANKIELLREIRR